MPLDAPRRHRPALAVQQMARSGEARRLREAAGIRPVTMARALRIAPSSFSNMEAGRWPPGARLGAAYARILRGLASHDAVSRELAAQEQPLAG